MIITIGGNAGSGKSTLAKYIAKHYNLRYISIGKIMRKLAKERNLTLVELNKIAEHDSSIDRLIDSEQKNKAKAGNCVIDSRLGAYLVDTDLKIWLTAPLEERAQRIAKRDKISIKEATNRITNRDKSEKNRYKMLYNINLDDLTIYDLVINTKRFSISQTQIIVINAIEGK